MIETINILTLPLNIEGECLNWGDCMLDISISGWKAFK